MAAGTTIEPAAVAHGPAKARLRGAIEDAGYEAG